MIGSLNKSGGIAYYYRHLLLVLSKHHINSKLDRFYALSSRQTCDSERVDDGRDDQVGHCEVDDENSSGVVAGGLRLVAPADKVLDGYRGDDDQVAQSSHHGGHSQHSDIRHGDSRIPTVQRPAAADRCLRTVRFNHTDEWKFHNLLILSPPSFCRYCLCVLLSNDKRLISKPYRMWCRARVLHHFCRNTPQCAAVYRTRAVKT